VKLHDLLTEVDRRHVKGDERLGQALVNVLRLNSVPGLDDIIATLDDPFYTVKTKGSYGTWVRRHLVIDLETEEVIRVQRFV
jgi:hypothetical protein